MMDHLMLFVIVAVFALFYWVYYTASRKGACTANWETLPTEQYLAAHRRRRRGSHFLHPLRSSSAAGGRPGAPDGYRRQHICPRCKQVLYRVE
jgi:hypothetical protein